MEVMSALKARGLDKRMEVYMDGGVRRGSDVLKALCLGAKAVGIGRPTLYAMAGYGADGVAHCFQVRMWLKLRRQDQNRIPAPYSARFFPSMPFFYSLDPRG